jgi:hypothetical protein
MATPQGIRAGKAFVELFADNTKLVRGLRTAEAKVRAFGASIKNMGMQMAMTGAAMMSPLIASAKVFGTFEKNMKMVSTMLDAPMKFMGAFGSGIRDMAMEFGESTDTLSKGMYDILSASIAPEGALNVLGVAVKAAKGGMTDAAIAVDGITSVLNAFQMAASKSTWVSDLMFKTVKRGKLVFEGLAGVIGRVAPMARAAQMPVEDMFAALATMTRQGLDAEEAATRLVNILKQAPAAAKNFSALIANYIGKDLATIQLDFPEIRAAGGIAALAGDMGGFLMDMKLMRNAAGAADEAFEKMSGGVISNFNKIWAIIKDIGISIGKALAPEMEKFAEWMKVSGKAVSDWIEKNQGLVVSYAKIAVGLTTLGIALVVFGTIIGGVATIVGVFASVLGLLVTPVGAVIAAIALMGGAIVKYTDTGGQAIDWLGGKFDFLRQDAEIAMNGIADAIAAGSIAQAAKILWLTLKMEWLRGTNYLHEIWSVSVGAMAKLATGAFTVIMTTFNIVAAGIKAAWIETASAFSWAYQDAIDGTAQKLLWLRSLIDKSFDYDASVASIDQDAEARNTARKAQDEKRLAEIGGEFDAKLKEYGQWNKDIRSNIDDITNSGIAENERALAAAQQEWRDSITEARAMRNRVAQDRPKPGEAPTPGMPGMPEMEMPTLPDFGDIGEVLQKARISTKGTFSAFAAFGLGVGSGVEDRTAKASEETAKNTRRMLTEMQRGGLEFT